MKRLVLGFLLVAGTAAAENPPTAAQIKQCDSGRAGKVCLDVGIYYINQTPKDYDKALGFYIKACKANVAAGCGYAGTMAYLGQGMKPDPAKGREWREKACKLKDGGSCNDLGTSYAEGKDGMAKDFTKSTNYYDQACKAGDGLGCFNYGNAQREGEGVPKNPKKAFESYDKSCKLDQAKGCTELGIAYYEGAGVTKDKAKAIETLEKACKLGSPVACKNADLLKQPPPPAK